MEAAHSVATLITALLWDAKLSPSCPHCRAELGLGDDYYQTSAGQRERLLQATDRLDRTTDRIQQGRQQLLETEVGTALKV